jgi:DNA-binding CsgD family transcriptional regulator
MLSKRLSLASVLGRARLQVLRATVVICLLISVIGIIGSIAGFTADGTLTGPATQLTLAWSVLWAIAAAFPAITAACFTRWSMTVGALAGANAMTAAVTGGISSPALGVCMYVGWLASVVVSARVALVTSMVIAASTITGYLLAGESFHDIFIGPDRYTAVSNAALPVLTGLVGALLASVTNSTFSQLPMTVAELRRGAPASSPAMTALFAERPLAELPRTAPSLPAFEPAAAPLTSTERAVVQQLAEGHSPQEIAQLREVKESTIRSHLKSAKQKTGARTLAHLVVLAWEDR